MSKLKFKLLIGFMVFSLVTLITVIAIEINNYIVARDTIEFNQNKNVSEIQNESSSTTVNATTPIEKSDALPEVIGIDDEQDETEGEVTVKTETSLLFGGDVLLTDYYLNLYDGNKSSINGMFSRELVRLMNLTDIMMVNQEFPFSTRGDKADNKQYTFRIDPNRVNILQEMGIDVVTLANNHTLDFGTAALLDTIATLDNAKIKHIGAGSDIEKAKEAGMIEINEKNIVFLGASRVIPIHEWNATKGKAGLFTTYDPSLLIEEIKKAKMENDLVIVYVHWGIERAEYPENYQRELGKQYIDAGADMVVGSHPHVLQGIEYYNEKPIIYSLGNFVFSSRTYQTMLLKAIVNNKNEISISLIPCESENGFMTLKDKSDLESFYEYIEKISFNISIDKDGIVKQIN